MISCTHAAFNQCGQKIMQCNISFAINDFINPFLHMAHCVDVDVDVELNKTLKKVPPVHTPM